MMTPKEARELEAAKAYQRRMDAIGEAGLPLHYQRRLENVYLHLSMLGMPEPAPGGYTYEQIEVFERIVADEANRQGVRIVCVDITDEAVERTRRKIEEYGTEGVSQTDLDRLRCADEKGQPSFYPNAKLYQWRLEPAI